MKDAYRSLSQKIEREVRYGNILRFDKPGTDEWAQVNGSSDGYDIQFWLGPKDENRDSLGRRHADSATEAASIINEWLADRGYSGDHGGMKDAYRSLSQKIEREVRYGQTVVIDKPGADEWAEVMDGGANAYRVQFWAGKDEHRDSMGSEVAQDSNEAAKIVEEWLGTRKRGARGMSNAGGEADQDAARELEIFVHNDADLYRRQFQPIQKNLITKKARGQYDHEKAVKLFMYLMESGAKKYSIEFGNGRSDPGEWHRTFSKPTREAAARIFVEEFETEAGYGNYDNYLPKKYQKKAGMGAGSSAKLTKAAEAVIREVGVGGPPGEPIYKWNERAAAIAERHGVRFDDLLGLDGPLEKAARKAFRSRSNRRGMGDAGSAGYAPLSTLPIDLRTAVTDAMGREGKDASRYVWKHDGAGNAECKER